MKTFIEYVDIVESIKSTHEAVRKEALKIAHDYYDDDEITVVDGKHITSNRNPRTVITVRPADKNIHTQKSKDYRSVISKLANTIYKSETVHVEFINQIDAIQVILWTEKK